MIKSTIDISVIVPAFQKVFDITHIKLPLYKYRQHQNNMTSNKKIYKKTCKKT